MKPPNTLQELVDAGCNIEDVMEITLLGSRNGKLREKVTAIEKYISTNTNRLYRYKYNEYNSLLCVYFDDELLFTYRPDANITDVKTVVGQLISIY